MADPITVVGGGAIAAYLAKDGLQKLLGPTADYFGGRLKDAAERADKNIESVLTKAYVKAADSIEENRTVSPRIAKQVIEEARFCEDELSAEYFGGILASSRAKVSRDDRGLHYISILKQLSTYEIRAHFIFYSVMRLCYKTDEHEISNLNKSSLDRLSILISYPSFSQAMGYVDEEDSRLLTLYCIESLKKHGLVGHGTRTKMPRANADKEKSTVRFTPSVLGMILFLWAHGYSNLQPGAMLDPALNIKGVANLRMPRHNEVSWKFTLWESVLKQMGKDL